MKKFSVEEIKELRLKLGQTREQFAHSLQLTLGTIAKWEAGASRPSPMATFLLNKLMEKTK